MNSHVILNNVTHKDLKINTQRSASLGDAVASVLTFPFEFRNILSHYPICFKKDEQSGEFYAAALMGFEENENLFLTESGWQASYIPLVVEREPFLIGFQASEQGGEPGRIIHVNMESPRISTTQGEPVFLPMGGNTPYLERIGSILEAIYQGQKGSKLFFDELIKHDLLEAFELSVTLNDGSENKLVGFYTVHEERLENLSGAALEALSRSGTLQHAYMALASLSNFSVLIDRKNRRLAAAK